MIITELLSPGGRTGTRSKLNYLLSLPFFLLVYWWSISLSLLSSHSSLSILRPPFDQGMGYDPKGIWCYGQQGEMVENSWVLEPGWGALTMSELNSQLHTHTFNGRKKRRGDRKLENGRNR